MRIVSISSSACGIDLEFELPPRVLYNGAVEEVVLPRLREDEWPNKPCAEPETTTHSTHTQVTFRDDATLISNDDLADKLLLE